MAVRIDKELGIAFLRPEGIVQAGDLRAHLEELMGHPDFESGMPSIWDTSGADVSRVEPRSMAALTEFIRDHRDRRGPARVAFVAESDLAFGIVRMYETLSQVDHLRTGAFRTMDEAIRWVQEEKGEAGA